MNQITPFNYGDNLIRVVNDETTGEPLWVAKDVCKILGMDNHRQALSRLDDDEKNGVILNDSMGREQTATAVNESGLYSLILSSRKPEAKPFKRWVTHEVLPAIRKTGTYSLNQNAGIDLSPLYAIMEAQTRILEHISNQNTLMLTLMDRLSKYEDTIHLGFSWMLSRTDAILNKFDKRSIVHCSALQRVTISDQQRSDLSVLVSERARCLSECYGIQPNVISTALYVGLKSRFGVMYYGAISASDYDDAVTFIENFNIGK